VAIAPWTHVFLAGQPRGRRRAAKHPGKLVLFPRRLPPFITEVSIAPRGCGKCASLSRQSCELSFLLY
jgi:hypothetical protein